MPQFDHLITFAGNFREAFPNQLLIVSAFVLATITGVLVREWVLKKLHVGQRWKTFAVFGTVGIGMLLFALHPSGPFVPNGIGGMTECLAANAYLGLIPGLIFGAGTLEKLGFVQRNGDENKDVQLGKLGLALLVVILSFSIGFSVNAALV